MTPPATAATNPAVDRGAIKTYCDVVFGYLDGYVPVRLLSEKGTPPQTPWQRYLEPGELAARLFEDALTASDLGRAVYVVPATVKTEGSARAEDIHQTGVVLVDLDIGDIAAKRSHLVRHLGRPTLEIASGGVTDDGQDKLHLYWRLTEAAAGRDLTKVASTRGLLAEKVGGDRSFRSLHQPARVAGSIHGKGGRRAPVRLIAREQVEYDLDELWDAVTRMPALETAADDTTPSRSAERRPKALELVTKKVRENGIDGITRFDALSTVIGHWIRNVRHGACDRSEAWEAVCGFNAAGVEPSWDLKALSGEFERLWKLDIKNHGPMPSQDATSEVTGEGVPLRSDDALASAFVSSHGDGWKYVPSWKSWFRWDGVSWVRDDTHLVREQMRLVCRSAALAAKAADARRVASEKTIGASLRIAAADPGIALTSSAWDAYPMLINTRSGVLDLESGEELPHDASLLLTQMTGAALGSGCARWKAFVDEVTDGDQELQGYLQRLAGYCLTGITSEQVFVFLHGQGANGKSVFLSTLAHVMGTYAATATLETFTAAKASRHLTELAGLRAARMVQVPETESGQGWAESRIKTVTGGEVIRANFMYQDHFEFRPQFKLIVAGNHRPTFANVGEAMRRRLHLVPFTVTIPSEKRDRHLADKLRAEADGILGWMVEGCLDWQRSGLAPPPSVLEAADEYFASEDLVGQWIAERCQVGPSARDRSAILFQSWKEWAEGNGYSSGTAKSLGESLRARGFANGKVDGARGWFGLSLDRKLAPQRGDTK